MDDGHRSIAKAHSSSSGKLKCAYPLFKIKVQAQSCPIHRCQMQIIVVFINYHDIEHYLPG